MSPRENRAARVAVDAAFAVHTQLGPGLLESVYEKCICHAIRRRGLAVSCPLNLKISGSIQVSVLTLWWMNVLSLRSKQSRSYCRCIVHSS